jgi:hypothetical protein
LLREDAVGAPRQWLYPRAGSRHRPTPFISCITSCDMSRRLVDGCRMPER